MTIARTHLRLNLDYITFMQGNPCIEKIITNQNTSYFALLFDNTRPLLQTGANHFGWGFLVGSGFELTVRLFSILNGGGLKTIQSLFKKSILKKVVYSGLITGAVGGSLRIRDELKSDRVVSPNRLLIKVEPVQNWYRAIEPLQEAFEYFLSNTDFIDRNTAAELTDTISQNLLSHPVITPCNHTFSLSQISEWQLSHSTCPNCRGEIGQNELRFDWPISLKLIKFVQYTIHTVQRSEYLLPQHLFTDEVKTRILNLSYETKQIMESIATVAQVHFRQMRARKEISHDDYDELTRSVYAWQINF
ncbi:U-box domain-containing protein [Rhabdochlamydiaceae symbiont of Dictyostelium giganteum]|uniref:U-box domain-containing protein n=1 Tax=Rhabdochlamydiaceae symbiont of Dictyostelium giganteum TaxID=3342349 RepID=UPI00384D11FC